MPDLGGAVRRRDDVGDEPRHCGSRSEFVAAILVGAGLVTSSTVCCPRRPWAMVVLLLLGFAAGVLNVVRATAEMNKATPPPPGMPTLGPDDDDD